MRDNLEMVQGGEMDTGELASLHQRQCKQVWTIGG
jgi:hypothetical protein